MSGDYQKYETVKDSKVFKENENFIHVFVSITKHQISDILYDKAFSLRKDSSIFWFKLFSA